MNGDDEIESGEYGRKAGDEDRDSSLNNIGIGVLGAEGGVESPAGIDASVEHAMQKEDAGGDVEIPAQQVDAGKREILGADHKRHQEIT